MEDLTYLITFTLLTPIVTLLISLKKGVIKVYKYTPSMLVFIGSIIFCIIMTIAAYSRYIGIRYVVVFLTTLPGIILSLIIAFVFDITRFLIKRRK